MNYNSFAHFQVWCNRQGKPDEEITPATIRAANCADLFGVIFNGDDHILRSTDQTVFLEMAEVLRDMGLVVVHKRPVASRELSRVGFLGGYVVRCVVQTRAGVRPGWTIVPDLERFLSSYCWQLNPVDEREWRCSVFRGLSPLLGAMPVYRRFLSKLVSESELRSCDATLSHKTDEDAYKLHKELARGTSIFPCAETWVDLSLRFTAGDVEALRRQEIWLAGLLAPLVPGRPALVRNTIFDWWLGNARN